MSVQQQIDRLLAQRAAEWFEVYRTGQTEQYPAFVAWLTESPRHMQEFLEIAGRYTAVRDALRSDVLDHQALLRKVRPPLTRALHSEGSQRRALTSHIKLSWATGLAAAVVLVTLGCVVWWLAFERWQSFSTPVGEQRVVQLRDGSVLTLNAHSRAVVRFSSSHREVRLIRGEALFKVAPDRSRPFLVHAGTATVQAVGTQFNVYARSDGSTTVAVLEGRVEVSGEGAGTQKWHLIPSKEQPPEPRVSLGPGEAASVGSTGDVQRAVNVDVDSTIAWRQRRLVFDRTPLENIVREFNRYNPVLKLRMLGVEPGSYHFTGSFDADDPRSLALLLSQEPQLSVEERDGTIVIRKRH
jgi:transmembrane sensor